MNINIDTIIIKKEYEKQISQLKAKLAKLPTDNIIARKKHGAYRYYVRTKDQAAKYHETYVSLDNKQYIAKCCQAKYLRNLSSALSDEIKAIRHFEQKYKPQAKYNAWDKLPEGYKQFVDKQYYSKKEIMQNWESAEFEHNSFPNRNENQYLTKKNEIVRSRIELIVADMLCDLGIPYRYECKLSLPAGIVYPDFTIMHPDTLELYYIEIFGMMDNPEYEQAAFLKIAKYAASDKYTNLIMFFDHKNAPISPANIKKILAAKFSLDSNGTS